MATTTSTTGALSFKETFEPGLIKTFDQGTPLLRLLGWPFKPAESSKTISWKLEYAGGTAVEINEGDALPSPSNLTFANMSVSPSLITDVKKITGHASDFSKSGDNYFNLVEKTMQDGVNAVLRKCETKCISLLEAAINDDTSYGGQTRATVHADSDVTAGGSAALTLAMLSEMYETLQLTPRSVEYDPADHMILSAPEQLTAYTELSGIVVTGDAEAAGANMPYVGGQGDAVMDLGKMKHSHRYNGIPWYTLSTMTNTLVLLLRRSMIAARQFSGLEMKELARVDDADSYQFRCHIGLAYLDPYRAARIEALTT